MTLDVPAALRAGTRDAHAALEAELDLLDDTLDRSRYTAVLERFLGFYEPFEDALDGAGASRLLDDWPGRRKAGWLADDLRGLGHDSASLAALPRAMVEAPASPAALLGSQYVVEGATLGGAVIAHRLGRRSGLPHRFFESYGPQRGRRWQTFLDVVRATVDDATAADDAVAAARQTFLGLHEWCAAA